MLCKTSNNVTGQCLSCYDGYTLVNANCIIPSQVVTNNTDPYCIKIQGSICLQCANGYFLGSNGVCQQVNPLCKGYNQTSGACISCYTGYFLQGVTCVIPSAVSIPYCTLLNAAGACIQCQSSYYVNGNVCSPVSILCATYDQQTGLCTSCVNGYFYQGGVCIYPALGLDPACEHYTNSYCDQCATGFYLSNYVCTQIDQNCIQFDYQNSVCTSCHLSTPQGPNCVWAKQCKAWYTIKMV